MYCSTQSVSRRERAGVSKELEQLPDAQLAEALAVEVAGFSKTINNCGEWGSFTKWKDKEGACTEDRHIHRFAMSADAVMPLLDKWAACQISHNYQEGDDDRGIEPIQPWVVELANRYEGKAPTLARAACIALIRAARAQKGYHA